MLLSKEAQRQLRRNGYSRISLAGDLPPAAPLIPWKPGTKKAAQKIVKLPISPSKKRLAADGSMAIQRQPGAEKSGRSLGISDFVAGGLLT
jgi:hypothetical protein